MTDDTLVCPGREAFPCRLELISSKERETMNPRVLAKFLRIALVGTLLLTACAPAGGLVTEEPAAAEPTAVEPTAVEPTAEQPAAMEITLRWRTRPDNQEEIEVYQHISDTLDEATDGVTLVYEPGGSQEASYQDVLKTELAAGTAPDVFWIPGTDVADFATRGLILDLRPYADATEGYSDDAFYPGPMYHLTFDPVSMETGVTLWGLPRDVSTMALYLNLDLIAEAGAPDPRELAAAGEWDWAALQEVAQAVSDLGGDVKGYGGSAWWGPYGIWMNAAGGGFFSEDRTACALDTEESLAGMEFALEFYASGVAIPYGEDPEPPFRAGTVGMFQNGRWATPGIRTVEFNWDVVDLPNGPRAGPATGSSGVRMWSTPTPSIRTRRGRWCRR